MPPDAELLTVAIYAGLNGLMLFALAAHVGRMRGKLNIPMGDGGDPLMVRAMRGQANFVEYVPFCLIVMLLMAMTGAPVWILHLFGIALTLGRALHGAHFVQADAPGWQRALGAGLTIIVLIGGSVWLIVAALGGLAR
jgi:hypothetical protein